MNAIEGTNEKDCDRGVIFVPKIQGGGQQPLQRRNEGGNQSEGFEIFIYIHMEKNHWR